MSQKDHTPVGGLFRFPPPPGEPADAALIATLTTREREMVSLIGSGMTNRQIGSALGISEWTVKTHVQNLREKLHVHTRAAIVAQSWDLIRDKDEEEGIREWKRSCRAED